MKTSSTIICSPASAEKLSINAKPHGEISVGYSIKAESFVIDKSNNDVEIIKISEENKFTVKVKAKNDVKLLFCQEKNLFTVDKNDYFLLNGYQSWTDTKEFNLKEKEKNGKKIPKSLNKTFSFDRYGDALFYDYDKNKLHGYDIFYSRGKNNIFLLNDNYKTAYLIFEINRKNGFLSLRSDFNGLLLKKGEEITLLSYYRERDYDSGIKLLDMLYPKKEVKKIFGYTSWYNHYQNINEEIILKNLDALDDRFNLFQIDDGYQTFVGDWLNVSKEKFPNGLKNIVDKIHDKGLLAGIWLAPFVAEEKSELFKCHNDYIKKDNDGNLIRYGANWSGFYALDLENPEVKDYIRKCLEYYVDLGFDFFKLDFLYAATMSEYNGKTLSRTAEDAYSLLSETLKGKLILGCGATVFNCIGKFDYLRVGPDVSLKFDIRAKCNIHRERVSTRTTIQNTVFRSFMDGRFFGNDPDVFLLRDDNIKLNDEQKKSLTTINALFGSVMMTSDYIPKYNEKNKEILSNAQNLFYRAKVLKYRKIRNKIEILYKIDDKEYIIRYNTKTGVIK